MSNRLQQLPAIVDIVLDNLQTEYVEKLDKTMKIIVLINSRMNKIIINVPVAPALSLSSSLSSSSLLLAAPPAPPAAVYKRTIQFD